MAGEWGQSIKLIGKAGQTGKEQQNTMKTKTKQNITLTLLLPPRRCNLVPQNREGENEGGYSGIMIGNGR